MFLTHDMVVLPFPRSTFFNFIDIPLCFPFQEKRKLTTWKKKDMDRQKQLNNWKETSSSFKRNIPPHEVFELFLTNEEMEKFSSNQQNMPVSKVNITLSCFSGQTEGICCNSPCKRIH